MLTPANVGLFVKETLETRFNINPRLFKMGRNVTAYFDRDNKARLPYSASKPTIQTLARTGQALYGTLAAAQTPSDEKFDLDLGEIPYGRCEFSAIQARAHRGDYWMDWITREGQAEELYWEEQMLDALYDATNGLFRPSGANNLNYGLSTTHAILAEKANGTNRKLFQDELIDMLLEADEHADFNMPQPQLSTTRFPNPAWMPDNRIVLCPPFIKTELVRAIKRIEGGGGNIIGQLVYSALTQSMLPIIHGWLVVPVRGNL